MNGYSRTIRMACQRNNTQYNHLIQRRAMFCIQLQPVYNNKSIINLLAIAFFTEFSRSPVSVATVVVEQLGVKLLVAFRAVLSSYLQKLYNQLHIIPYSYV